MSETTDIVCKLLGKAIMLLESNHSWPMTERYLYQLGYSRAEIQETERYIRDLEYIKRFS